MKKILFILLAVILGILDLFLLSVILVGIAIQGFNGLILIIIMVFLLILAMIIRCVIGAIRIKELKNPDSPAKLPPGPAPAAEIVFCEYCGRQIGEERVCPSCGALRP